MIVVTDFNRNEISSLDRIAIFSRNDSIDLRCLSVIPAGEPSFGSVRFLDEDLYLFPLQEAVFFKRYL